MKTSLMYPALLAVFAGASCTLVPFIKPCHIADKVCLKSSAQAALPVVAAGLPRLSVARLDPMLVEHISADAAGLLMEFNNTVVRGLRHCRILDIGRDEQRLSLAVQCSVVLKGDYRLSGDLLVFPVRGSGRYKIVIRDIVVKVALETSEREEGGDRFWTVGRWTQSAQVLTSVVFRFENLFNGNKALARSVIKFANENWRDFFPEVSPPIMEAIVGQIVRETTHLFQRVPISQLTLD